ncbi:MAG: hypothetical protein HS111_14440 [Kofleriaceae bacterium]|nr:hypothetical protein [Kofleriaceae bacterium]
MVARKARVLSVRLTDRLYAAIEAAARRGLRPAGQQAVLMLAEALVKTGDLSRRRCRTHCLVAAIRPRPGRSRDRARRGARKQRRRIPRSAGRYQQGVS